MAYCHYVKPPSILKFKLASFSLLNLIFLFSILMLISHSVSAKGGKVEALQMPAWLERNGELRAIEPGIELQTGDMLITGGNARLLLRLDEGSLIKLGENAKLDFNSLLPADEEQGFFEAVIKVVKGAFRFSTTALGENRRRQVEIRIGSITAGIRGTDIWGSSYSEKDILCLIEGEITAKRRGEPEFEMRDALSFYTVPRNKPAPPVAPVGQATLASWAAQTELQAGQGVLNIDGRWLVNLISMANRSSLQPILTSLTAAGYAAEIEHATVKGKRWYRLRIKGFKSRSDASFFASSIKGKYGISSSWIIRI